MHPLVFIVFLTVSRLLSEQRYPHRTSSLLPWLSKPSRVVGTTAHVPMDDRGNMCRLANGAGSIHHGGLGSSASGNLETACCLSENHCRVEDAKTR